MSRPLPSHHRHATLLVLVWRRALPVAGLCTLLGLLLSLGWNSMAPVMTRVFVLGFSAMLVFTAIERWPRTLPRWLARWVLQVAGVAFTVPAGTLLIYLASTPSGGPPFWEDSERLSGFFMLSVTGTLVAPWVALAALIRQKDVLAQQQALLFELQRSELERQALDTRLQLLQRQVAPHFLFNTLANVQALIDIGSPRASDLMRSLTAYLRAAVPRLDAPMTTLAEEAALARAYLELMQMRMPDRLVYTMDMAADTHAFYCPSMTLLTLVENAVKHGIDPTEDGGSISIRAWRAADHWHLCVEDTGAGLHPLSHGNGTGLATLRDRLALAFGGAAQLHISACGQRGVLAEVIMPIGHTT